MSRDGLQQQLTAGMTLRNWLLLAGLSAASLAFWDLKFSLGVLAGGLVSIANFGLLRRVLLRQFEPGRRPSVSGVLIRYYLRFAGTAVILLVLLKYHLVGAIGLLVGLSVIVLNLTMTGLMLFRRAKLKEAH